METGNIYIIKNYINDKVYIGQTTLNINERFKLHKKCARLNTTNQIIHRAIRKYGVKNFFVEELESKISINQLDEREEYYISKYDSYHSGYNMNPGGNQWRKKPIDIDIEFISRMYIKGLSSRDISKHFDVSHNLILTRLDKAGIARRPKENCLPDKTVPIKNKEKVLRHLYLEEKLSKREIARRLNVSDRTIRRWLKELNIVGI